MNVDELVTNWGGFEELVKKLHETGEVTVERDVTLLGRSGAPRQIDVLVRHKQGLYEHVVIIECKYWNSNVGRDEVDKFAATVQEVGASRGVIFTTKGFQSGAITQATHDHIDLFVVRDLTDKEWGLPGRVVDLFLHVIQPGIGKITIEGASKIGNPFNVTPIAFNLEFGSEGPVSSTPTLKADGTLGDSIEKYLFDAVHKALDGFIGTVFLINGGEPCTRYFMQPINLVLSRPFQIPVGGEIAIIPKMSFELGIKIAQSRITVDRALQYKFAIAVENCINGTVSAAARRDDDAVTTVSDLVPVTPPLPGDQVLQNGSIMRVVIKGLFPIEEMAELTPIPFPTPNG